MTPAGDGGTPRWVSPFTGQVFGTQFAYNRHLATWEIESRENGLNLDGTPVGATVEPTPAPTPTAKPKVSHHKKR